MKSELKEYLEQNLRIKQLMLKEYEENMRVLHLNELGLISQEINFLELCLMLLKKEIKEKDEEIEMLRNDLTNYETCCPECGTILKVSKPKLQLKKSDFEWQHECDVDSYQDCADKKCGNKLILKDKWNYENLEE